MASCHMTTHSCLELQKTKPKESMALTFALVNSLKREYEEQSYPLLRPGLQQDDEEEELLEIADRFGQIKEEKYRSGFRFCETLKLI